MSQFFRNTFFFKTDAIYFFFHIIFGIEALTLNLFFNRYNRILFSIDRTLTSIYTIFIWTFFGAYYIGAFIAIYSNTKMDEHKKRKGKFHTIPAMIVGGAINLLMMIYLPFIALRSTMSHKVLLYSEFLYFLILFVILYYKINPKMNEFSIIGYKPTTEIATDIPLEQLLVKITEKRHETKEALDHDDIGKARELLAIEMQYHNHGISIAQNLDLDDLTLKLIRRNEINKQMMRKIIDVDYSRRYQDLFERLEKEKHAKYYQGIHKILVSMQDLTNAYKKTVRKYKSKEDIKELNEILDDLDIKIDYNRFVIEYTKFEQNYNKVIENVEKNNLQKAKEALQLMIPEIQNYLKKIMKYMEKSEEITEIYQVSTALTKNMQELQASIVQQYNQLFDSTKIEPLEVEKYESNLKSLKIKQYGQQPEELKAYIHTLDQQFLEWEKRETTNSSKIT
ncbi:hypothetical protein [Candidatus Lokiarchaeum ossiferum]|uniref:hypothetical protein n=1 Tax=Candidatus Lokiarchaeum ossiferum TaxID=2951803 RepID=UPI00352E2BF6